MSFSFSAILPVLLTAAPVALASPAQSQTDELETLLRERAAGLSEAPLEGIWTEARSLTALVGDEAGAAYDATLDRLLQTDKDLGARAVLLFSAARFQGEDIDYELIAERLQPLLDGDIEIALGAANLLGDERLRALPTEAREQLADALLGVAKNGDKTPTLRVECAVSVHRVGRGNHLSGSRRVLFDFLDSSDPQLRNQGVLALARLGVFEAIDGQLESLAALPGEEGRLAEAYLKQQKIQRIADAQLRSARERSSGLVSSGEVTSVDLVRIEKVIDLIQGAHLEGEHATRDFLINAALDGMLKSLDRHSSYFSPDIYKKFEQDLEAEYGGIGAYVGNDPEDNLFTITRPIYSGPAYRGGLATDDKIVQIGDWPTIGEEVDDIIKRLKGRPGTEVKLYIWRRGMDPATIDRPTEEMAVTLTREQIVIPPVHSEYLPGDVGLVELTTFSRVAGEELEKRIVEMRDRGMKALIFDLRNNTGGLLTQAQDVADLFLSKGKTVVSTESRLRRGRDYETRRDAVIPEDMPVVVLINRFSASAAEIVAGALQDHGRATLIGQRSFGKGSVQNLFRLPGEEDDVYADENRNGRHDNWEPITKDHNGDGVFDYSPRIKLTIERYLLPTGRSIHRELDSEGNIESLGGVDPDMEVRAKRWDQWRLEELLRIQRDRLVRNWLAERFQDNRLAFEQLAMGDNDDTSAYPEFAELHASLNTVLPEQDVRFLVRREVRRLVQDLRGEAFPAGDFQEDLQVQAAVRKLYEDLGEDVNSITAYAKTFDEAQKASRISTPAPIARGPVGVRDVDSALALIAEATDAEGNLSAESLQRLTEILESMREN